MLPKILQEILDENLVLSLEDNVGKIFSKKRIELLLAIREKSPNSIYDLAKYVSRSREAVLRDLKILENYGIIEFGDEKGSRLMKAPRIVKKILLVPLETKTSLFEIIEHPADIGFKAKGKDLNELFENSSVAFFELITDTAKVMPVLRRDFKVEGEDLKSLMYDYLEELLYVFEVEGIVFSRFEVEVKGTKIHSVGFGEKISENHKFKNEIKAITYHMMRIEKKDFWEAQVIVDI